MQAGGLPTAPGQALTCRITVLGCKGLGSPLNSSCKLHLRQTLRRLGLSGPSPAGLLKSPPLPNPAPPSLHPGLIAFYKGLGRLSGQRVSGLL